MTHPLLKRDEEQHRYEAERTRPGASLERLLTQAGCRRDYDAARGDRSLIRPVISLQRVMHLDGINLCKSDDPSAIVHAYGPVKMTSGGIEWSVWGHLPAPIRQTQIAAIVGIASPWTFTMNPSTPDTVWSCLGIYAAYANWDPATLCWNNKPAVSDYKLSNHAAAMNASGAATQSIVGTFDSNPGNLGFCVRAPTAYSTAAIYGFAFRAVLVQNNGPDPYDTECAGIASARILLQ